MQELTQWCSNNWRMAHGRGETISRFPTRRIEVLWTTSRDLVEKEILRLREEEGKTNPAFELRTTASKNVINKMTEEELTELNKAVADMEEHGYSEEHKRKLVCFMSMLPELLTLYYL
jgi:hypothetical protein